MNNEALPKYAEEPSPISPSSAYHHVISAPQKVSKTILTATIDRSKTSGSATKNSINKSTANSNNNPPNKPSTSRPTSNIVHSTDLSKDFHTNSMPWLFDINNSRATAEIFKATEIIENPSQQNSINRHQPQMGEIIPIGPWESSTYQKAEIHSNKEKLEAKADGTTSISSWGITASSTDSLRDIGVQCQGKDSDLKSTINVYAEQADGTHKQRFGRAISGDVSVTRFEVAISDKLKHNVPPRCEQLIFPSNKTGVSNGRTFWHAIEIWTDDWAQTDDEQLVIQWHQNDPRLRLNPFLAAIIQGSKMRIELRTSSKDPATRDSVLTTVASAPSWKPLQWNTFVTKLRITPNQSESPFTQIWINGEASVNSNQPIGYHLQNGSYNYPKWGIYKWTNGNLWDTRVPVRSVMVRNVLLLEDEDNQHTLRSIEALLAKKTTR